MGFGREHRTRMPNPPTDSPQGLAVSDDEGFFDGQAPPRDHHPLPLDAVIRLATSGQPSLTRKSNDRSELTYHPVTPQKSREGWHIATLRRRAQRKCPRQNHL